jgi:CDP-diacylglycerol--serine O-phosphatidyltransferase
MPESDPLNKMPPMADDDVDLSVTHRPRRRGIYILPNLFTLAALFGGFYAIVMAMNDRFDQAAYGIFIAAVLDSLDGRVARMTNTQSAFGEQMDSLSDMVSFGAAPALIVYEWVLYSLGKAGWIAAFVYCACAALRLARFNTNIGVIDKRFFQGLTMVTNLPFYSFKDVSMKRSVPFIVIVAIALGFALISTDPPTVLFALFCLYGLSGYVLYGYRKAKGKPVSVIATSTDEPDERGLH